MDQSQLRSGTSLWRACGAPQLQFSPLEGEVHCEVVIVGSGITGALVSHILSQQGVESILVDKEAAGAGSTAASTGLLQYEVDTPLIELIKKVGECKAVHAYRRGLWAIDELESLIGTLHDSCGFARRATLCLASSEQDLDELRAEFECRRHFGFDVGFWERDGTRDRYGISAPGVLASAGDAEVDPYALTQGSIQAALTQGMRVFDHSEIVEVRAKAGGIIARSKAGQITAKYMVLATGYSAKPFLGDELVDLQTTYAVASEPGSWDLQWPDRCLLWETARPYFYARQTPDGRALIGGEDTPFSDDHQDPELLARKAERLAERFRELFPGAAFEPAFVWGGTFAETHDGLPFIGRRAEGDRFLFALGYGGNGITYSMIAARLICDLVLGRRNEDAEVFGFRR